MAEAGGPLEFVIRVLGGPASAAEVKGVARSFNDLAVAQDRSSASAKRGTASSAALGRAMKYTAAGLVGVVYEATKMGLSFDAQMERIHTQAGMSQAAVDALSKQVVGLAKSGEAMGASPNSLAEALYHLASLRLPKTINLMDALKVSAEGAAVGGSDLSDTASVLGATLKAAIPGTGNLGHTMGTLNAIVGAGNMKMQNLIDALGTGILPVAGLAGVSLQQVGAAIAELTDQAMPASSAATQLATAMHYLYSPTTKATDALRLLHLHQFDLAREMRSGPRGLISALIDLRTHLRAFSSDPNVQMGILGNIFPGGRGRTLQILLAQLKENFPQQKLAQIFQGQGAFPQGVAATQATAANQLATAWGKVLGNMIDVYHALRPTLIPALLALGTGLAALAHILPTLLAVLLPVVAAWAAWKAVMIGSAIVEGIGVALDALTAAFVILNPAIDASTAAMFGFDVAASPLIAIEVVIAAIIAAVVALGVAIYEVVTHWHQVKAAASNVLGWMGRAVVNVGHAIKSAFVSAINWVIRAWDSLHFTLPHINLGPLGTIGGGTVGVPQIAQIGGGASAAVTPSRVQPARGLPHGVFGAPQQITLTVDGQVLARALHRQTQSQQARGG